MEMNGDATLMAATAPTCHYDHADDRPPGKSWPATHHCHGCNQSLCLRCVDRHDLASKTKDHRIELISGMSAPANPVCESMVRNVN